MYQPNSRAFTTPIKLQRRVTETINGAKKVTWVDEVLDERLFIVQCEWKNFHGREAVQMGALQIDEGATLILWYHPAITEHHRIIHMVSGKAYEIVSMDNIEDRNRFLELKVKRVATA